jgi:short-subunit dehydrogenase involved in D-alanine esterification of teichoic acids
MSVEKTVLEIATATGVEGAYFYEGTLFVPADQDEDAFLNFEAALEDRYPVIDIIFSNCGDEVAIDFAGSKQIQDEFSPFVTMNS